MELWLVDLSPVVISALKQAFLNFQEVNIIRGNIIDVAENTIVSPGNGYGYMDGGIDLIYRNYFGSQLESTVQQTINRKNGDYLPVGSSIVIQTHNKRIPYTIFAPTMVLPEIIPPINCFYAMFAILQAITKHQDRITKVYCPGLGTGVGGVSPEESAREMALAYKIWQSRKCN